MTKILGFLKYLIIVIIILLCFELVARVASPDKSYAPMEKYWDLNKYTNLFGQKDGKEELKLHSRYAGYITVKVQKPPGVRRIIFLGQRQWNGKYGTILDVLQENLDSYYGRGEFEVINGVFPSAVSYQSLVYFEEVLLKLTPDIVILYMGYCDSNYTGLFRDREYYQKIKLVATQIKYDIDKIQMLYKYGLPGLNTFYRLIAESRLSGYIRGTTCYDRIKGFFFKSRQRMGPDDQEYVLMRFIELSKKYNFKLIFSPEVTTQDTQAEITAYRNLMRRLSKEENVFFADVQPALRMYKDSEVFSDSVHLTSLGHKAAGVSFFEFIKDMLTKS